MQIDLREGYCWALMRTLHAVAEFADDDAGKAVCGAVERRGLASVHDVEAERVGVLGDFNASARSYRRACGARRKGEGFVLDVAA